LSNFEWAWKVEWGERAHGPFKTKEEAIADAKDYYPAEPNDCPSLMLGKVVWPDPGEHVQCDVDDLMERADENAYDAGCWCDDDELYVLKGLQEEAQKDLNELLAAWARKWLSPSKWTFEELEELIIEELASNPSEEVG